MTSMFGFHSNEMPDWHKSIQFCSVLFLKFCILVEYKYELL